MAHTVEMLAPLVEGAMPARTAVTPLAKPHVRIRMIMNHRSCGFETQSPSSNVCRSKSVKQSAMGGVQKESPSRRLNRRLLKRLKIHPPGALLEIDPGLGVDGLASG